MQVTVDEVRVLQVFKDALLEAGGSPSALANPTIVLSVSEIERRLTEVSTIDVARTLETLLASRKLVERCNEREFKLCPPALSVLAGLP